MARKRGPTFPRWTIGGGKPRREQPRAVLVGTLIGLVLATGAQNAGAPAAWGRTSGSAPAPDAVGQSTVSRADLVPATAVAASIMTTRALPAWRVVTAQTAIGDDQQGGDPDLPGIIPNHYIVVLREPDDGQLAPVPQVAAAMAAQYGLTLGHVYEYSLRGFAAVIPPERAVDVRSDSRVDYLMPDRVVRADNATASASATRGVAKPSDQITQQATLGLQRIGGSTDGIHQTLANKGAGVGVAIIDSGIELTHPDLAPVVNGKTCIAGTTDAQDLFGHGTHVAGIVAARDNAFGVVGVAPEATLFAVKVLDATGYGAICDLICGVEWVTQNWESIQVANMSLGVAGTATPSYANCKNATGDALHEAICNSVRAGMTYVVSAGNDSQDARLQLPAAYEEVITVSAMDDVDGVPGGAGSIPTSGCLHYVDDSLAPWSNNGPAVALAAPGVCIRSTYISGSYALRSGTSQAAPHVAGAAALFIAANPTSTPADVRAGLLAAAEAGPLLNDSDGYPEGVVHVLRRLTDLPPIAALPAAAANQPGAALALR